MRKKIYQTVHVYDNSKLSITYKYIMIFFIILSLIPLTSKSENMFFTISEMVCLGVFIIDFMLRWITADYKFGTDSKKAFIKYPLRIISFIDMVSIFALFCSVFNLFNNSKLVGILTVFRIIRILRYSKSVRTILNILKKSKKPLFAVGSLALGYILLSAIIVFNVEPDSFSTFFEAIYWSTISLTTVGYGDIYPITALGRTVAMLSSFFGIAIVALPAGIVTAEYLNSIKKEDV
ncbi:MAG: ion transporter [Clostridia bacterium]|nr:ion transporter [Clostridia bacterium]